MPQSGTIVRSAVAVWLLAVLAAAAIAHWLLPNDPQSALFALGLLCMAYTLAAFGLARRTAGLTALLPLAWAAAFGMWMPIAQDYGSEHFAPILATLGAPETLLQPLALATVLLAGGIMTGAMLYLGTASAAVFVHVLVLTALVAGATLSHSETPNTTFAAVIAWHAGIAGSLMRWASQAAWASRQGLCPACGEDITGVRNRVCPSCKSALLCAAPPPTPTRTQKPDANRAA